MKEATGELNMTVITVIAIAAIAALFYVFVWPMIQRTIADRTCQAYGVDYRAYKTEVTASDENTSGWECCRGDNRSNCVPMEDE